MKNAPQPWLGGVYYVIRLGFEPKTHSLEGCCSIQLSYQTILNRCKGTDIFGIVKCFSRKNLGFLGFVMLRETRPGRVLGTC